VQHINAVQRRSGEGEAGRGQRIHNPHSEGGSHFACMERVCTAERERENTSKDSSADGFPGLFRTVGGGSRERGGLL